MAARERGPVRWKRWLGGEAPAPPYAGSDGPEIETTGLGALARFESSCAEAICAAGPLLPGVALQPRDDARQALETAGAMAATGRRVTALLAGGGLADAVAPLRSLVERRVPLVVHAVVADGNDLEDLLRSGAALAVARDARHALDLALVARRVAERALLPVVVTVDRDEIADAPCTLALPAAGLVRDLVGGVDDEIETPGPAQRLLFGERRRRVPRWFDRDRPLATGLRLPAAEREAARAAREVMFDDPLADEVRDAAQRFHALTGRDTGDLLRRGRRDAGHVVLTQGAAAVTAEAAAEGLDRGARRKLAVVEVTWRRPLPLAPLRRTLEHATVVSVLERAASTGEPALLRDVRAVMPHQATVVSAVHGRLDGPAAEALWRNSLADAPASRLHLGVLPPSVSSRFPRRQALLQRVRRDFPALSATTLETERPGEAGTGADGGPPPSSETLPLVVRRLGATGETLDNVARFWGEQALPARYEPEGAAVPEPYVASGAVPPCTASFHDYSTRRESVAVLDPARCSGCGRCWISCPDSAIGAVAIGTEALLDHGAATAEAAAPAPQGAAAARLRRAHKQLASKLNGTLRAAGPGALTQEPLREAYGWLAGKLAGDDAERQELDEAFESTLDAIHGLPLAVTAPFFIEPESANKGDGELLLLAVSPSGCRGCGICAAVCPEEAFRMTPQTEQHVDALRAAWKTWEALPDTAGATIARAGERADVGSLAGVLMSRHVAFSVGGGGAEAGSGARVAARQVTAVVEYEMQRKTLAQLEALADLERRLRQAIREAVAPEVETVDLAKLDDALGDAPGDPRLVEALRGTTEVDAARLARLVSLARDVERWRARLAGDGAGAGRSRYGIVLAGGADELLEVRYPDNPFGVPLLCDTTGDGTAMAGGILESLRATRLAEVRLFREAELVLAAPGDLRARERALDALSWRDLTAEERAACPPVLLLGGTSLARRGGLFRLLSSDLPVLVVVLDEADFTSADVDPVLGALAHREAFVLSSSIAHPEHLFAGVAAALGRGGPALVRLHAPSPARHGFPAESTIERARLAVESRVLPLLRYDPAGEGVFGSRIDLAGNPAPDRPWAAGADDEPPTPASWAAGERRFDPDNLPPAARGTSLLTVPGPNGGGLAPGGIFEEAARRCTERWSVLQELAGVVTPFTGTVRARLERELGDGHDSELARLRAEHAAALQASERDHASSQVERLRRRLLQLAGYA